VPLSDMLRSDAGKKVLSVPFLTGYKDLAADRVELTIILPEGAKYVLSFLPALWHCTRLRTDPQGCRGPYPICGRFGISLNPQDIPRYNR
jgi:hypothetical protein